MVQPSASSAPTGRPTKSPTFCKKFARTVLGTNNIDHHRTADYAAFAKALKGKSGLTASLADTGTSPAVLLIGNDPTEQHPLLAWNLRTNLRHNRARIYIVNHEEIKLRRQAKAYLQVPLDGYAAAIGFLAGDDTALTAGDAGKAFREAVRGRKGTRSSSSAPSFAAAISKRW